MDPIHVIGGGSIGLLFSGSIRSAFPSYPLQLLLREHHRSRIDTDTNTIMVCLIKGKRPRMVPVPAQIIASNSNNNQSQPRPIQNLLVSTKAYHAADAVTSVLSRLDAHQSSIILLCNGAFAVKEEISRVLSNATNTQQSYYPNTTRLILATTTHGAYQITEPNHPKMGMQQHSNNRNNDNDDTMYRVVHAGQGLTFVENHPSLSQLWDQSGLSSQSISSHAMNVMLWHKLAANCAINPLTALYQCENGQLLSFQNQENDKRKPSSSSSNNNLPTLRDIIQEVSLVATKLSDDSLKQSLDYDTLRSFVDKVIQDAFHNKSSMLQDVTKRQKTEIDYLCGYIVQKGKELGIETPANSELCQRIHELSSSTTDD